MYPATVLATERKRRCKPRRRSKSGSCSLLVPCLNLLHNPLGERNLPLAPTPPVNPPILIVVMPILGVESITWTAPGTMDGTFITAEPFTSGETTRVYLVRVQASGSIFIPVPPFSTGIVVSSTVRINGAGNQRVIELSPEVSGNTNADGGTISFNLDASLTGIQILPSDTVTFHIVATGVTDMVPPASGTFNLNPGATISLTLLR